MPSVRMRGKRKPAFGMISEMPTLSGLAAMCRSEAWRRRKIAIRQATYSTLQPPQRSDRWDLLQRFRLPPVDSFERWVLYTRYHFHGDLCRNSAEDSPWSCTPALVVLDQPSVELGGQVIEEVAILWYLEPQALTDGR